MEVGLTFEAERYPSLALVAAANQPERVYKVRTRRGMAAAIEALRSRREAHVIVLWTGSLRPLAVLVNRQAVVAGDHQPLAIRTIREAVDMDENDRGLRVRPVSGPTCDEQRHHDLPRPFE